MRPKRARRRWSATWTAPGVIPSRRPISAWDGAARIGCEGRLESVEQLGFPCAAVVPCDGVLRVLQEARGPGAVEQALGRIHGRRLETVAGVGVPGVEREFHDAPASFQSVVAIAGVGDEEPAVGEQERAKPAPCRVGCGDGPLFEQAGEECLCQVIRVVGALAVMADESVNRVPVRGAQLCESAARASGSGSPPARATRLQRVVGNLSGGPGRFMGFVTS